MLPLPGAASARVWLTMKIAAYSCGLENCFHCLTLGALTCSLLWTNELWMNSCREWVSEPLGGSGSASRFPTVALLVSSRLKFAFHSDFQQLIVANNYNLRPPIITSSQLLSEIFPFLGSCMFWNHWNRWTLLVYFKNLFSTEDVMTTDNEIFMQAYEGKVDIKKLDEFLQAKDSVSIL